MSSGRRSAERLGYPVHGWRAFGLQDGLEFPTVQGRYGAPRDEAQRPAITMSRPDELDTSAADPRRHFLRDMVTVVSSGLPPCGGRAYEAHGEQKHQESQASWRTLIKKMTSHLSRTQDAGPARPHHAAPRSSRRLGRKAAACGVIKQAPCSCLRRLNLRRSYPVGDPGTHHTYYSKCCDTSCWGTPCTEPVLQPSRWDGCLATVRANQWISTYTVQARHN